MREGGLDLVEEDAELVLEVAFCSNFAARLLGRSLLRRIERVLLGDGKLLGRIDEIGDGGSLLLGGEVVVVDDGLLLPLVQPPLPLAVMMSR